MRKLLSSRPKPKIEFLCDPEDRGVIADGTQAKSVLVRWSR